MPKDTASNPSRGGAGGAASSPKTAYLVLYNGLSAAAWSVVLAQTVTLFASKGARAVYPGVGEWTRITQTAACMEVLHSLLGIVRAPVATTVLQVSSRLLLVWGIVNQFPYLALTPYYTSMLVAWSITEVIRYSFFATSLCGWRPQALTWLRYNTFFALYPLGIGSECALILLATQPAGRIDPNFKLALYAVLAIYVPGSYILYTHMMTQRQKVMRGNKTA